MSGDWPVVKINDLCEVVTKGTTPTSVGHQFTTNGVNFIKVESISSDGRVFKEKLAHISDDCHAKLKRSQILEGDILFSIAGALGRTAVVTADVLPANTNQALSIIRLKQHSGMYNRFLAYFLSSGPIIEQIENARGGAAQQNLSLAQVKAFQVPLPPLDEQKRTVSILDQAFEGLDRARANAEANLESAGELKESIRTSVFERNDNQFERVKLSEVSDITSSLVDPKDMKYRHLPHIGAGNMLTLSDDLIEVKTAAEENLISQKYLYDESMVLYSKIRPYLRKAARPSFGGLCSADVYPLLPSSGVLDRDFLFHLLLSDDFTRYAEAGSARAGMPKVNRKHLFDYEFSLPSISVQQDMVKAIDRTIGPISELMHQIKLKLSEIEVLRQSLLQKAFSGELT